MVRYAGARLLQRGTEEANLIFRSAFVTQLGITSLICAVILLQPAAWSNLISKGEIPAMLVGILAIGLWGLSCYEFIGRATSAQLKFRSLAWIQVLLSLSRFIALVVCILMMNQVTLTVIVLIYMLSYWLVFLWTWPMIRSMFQRRKHKEDSNHAFFSWPLSKKLLRYGGWVSFSNILYTSSQNLGPILILQFSQQQQAGIFGLALVASGFLIIFNNAIQNYLLPYASRLGEKDSPGQFFRSTLKITIPLAALAILVILAGYPLFPLWLGSKGSAAYPVFALLCLAQVIYAVIRPVHNIFHFLYKPYLQTLEFFFRLAILIPMAFWLIPKAGAYGMAIAQVTAILGAVALSFILFRVQLYKYNKHEISR